jgi:hypothetical protein
MQAVCAQSALLDLTQLCLPLKQNLGGHIMHGARMVAGAMLVRVDACRSIENVCICRG